MNIQGRPVVAFDPRGLVFAVGLESKTIRLYDTANFDKVKSFSFPSGLAVFVIPVIASAARAPSPRLTISRTQIDGEWSGHR